MVQILKPPEVNPRGSNEPRFNPRMPVSPPRGKRKARRSRRGKR